MPAHFWTRFLFGSNLDADPQGAPYGYTPFCDNNKDMDGFRFWNQGFWRDHLRGKPYHISALYVIDLARFRCGKVRLFHSRHCDRHE